MTILSRRHLLNGGLVAAAASISPRAAFAQDRIVLTDPGGSTEAAYAKAFYKPFERETGVQIAFSARPNLALGQLKSMALANNAQWDVTYLTDYLVELAAKEGLLDKIDYSKINPALVAEMLPGTVTPYLVGGSMFATVQCHSTKKWPAGQGPQNWADFWDVKRFPGRRSMVGFGHGPIEQALLADGVPKEKLYPLDLDRAFKKLDEIKEQITVWTTSSAQQHQLLVNDEVDLLQGFANRIQSAITDGASFAIQWRDGSVNHEGWVIPKNAKNRELVLRFIEYSLDAKRQSEAVVGVGATNSRATSFMPDAQARTLPTYRDNFAKMYLANAKWLAENQEALVARWTQWRAG